MGDLRFTSISSYSDRDVLVLRDATALDRLDHRRLDRPGPEQSTRWTRRWPTPPTLQTFTQEVRLSSTGEGPLQWVIGGFYSTIDRDYAQDLYRGRASAR